MAARHKRAQNAERAFTIVEVALVVAVIGVLAGITVPRYGQFIARRQLEAAVRRVDADLAEARRLAMRTSTSRTIEFDTISQSYRLVGTPDPDIPSRECEVHLARDPYRAAVASVDLGGATAVTFDGFGESDVSGSIKLVVGAYSGTVKVGSGSPISVAVAQSSN